MLFLREHNAELYRAFTTGITRTNEVILFLLGRPAEDGSFPDVFLVVAGVFLGVFEDSDETGQIKYWLDVRDSFESQSPRNTDRCDIEGMLSIANQENSWDLRESVALACKRIELMQKITITD